MTDVMTMISMGFNDLKTMMGIVSIIKQAQNSYERAELQLEFGKLADFLRDNEERLRDIERVVIEKDKRIAELEDILKHKNSLIRHEDAYYEKDVDGNASGNPFCMGCWDIHYKKINLIRNKNSANIQVCLSCKNEQNIWRAPPIKINQTDEAIEKPIPVGSCYRFSDNKQLYCSPCYDNHGKKSLVTRVGSRGLCQCPTCKATLSMN